MFTYHNMIDITKKIFNMNNNTTKTINSLSSLDPISGIYILQE